MRKKHLLCPHCHRKMGIEYSHCPTCHQFVQDLQDITPLKPMLWRLLYSVITIILTVILLIVYKIYM